MYTIIEYNENYENKIKKFICSIFVHEYGYKNCEEEILNENLSHYIEQGGNFWIALDSDDNVIGTIGAKKIDNDTMELKRMYVHKDYRGKGISSELLKHFEAFSKLQNCKHLKLSTRTNLERAIAFYKKHSFTYDLDKPCTQDIVYLHKEI